MILVDSLTSYPTCRLRCKTWCHMVSDESLAELHAFADVLGLRRSWFQEKRYAHYDLMPARRASAVVNGAIEVPSRELLVRNFDYRVRRGLLKEA